MSADILVDCCICGGKVVRDSADDAWFHGDEELNIEGGSAHRCCAEASRDAYHWLFAVRAYVDENDEVPPVPIAHLADWLHNGGELLEEHGLWLLDEMARLAAGRDGR